MEELKRTFRPEFLNRIDEIIVFHALNRQHISRIIDIMLKELKQQLQEKRITLEVSDAAKELVADSGYDPDFGARPLRRAIQKMIENPLAELILQGKYSDGETVHIDSKDGELVFS